LIVAASPRDFQIRGLHGD